MLQILSVKLVQLPLLESLVLLLLRSNRCCVVYKLVHHISLESIYVKVVALGIIVILYLVSLNSPDRT